MAPKYTHYYYSGKGRGEIIRQLFFLAGVPLEDIRFEHEEWLEKYKPVSPFGQCPYLVIEDGHTTITLCQSSAIGAYFARKWGYAGESLLEQARVEMIYDSVDDYMVKLCTLIRREKTDPERKANMLKLFREEQLPNCFRNLTRQLEANEHNSGWFVGKSMTWADMSFAHWARWIVNGVGVEPPFDQFPKLKALVEKVESHPKIAEWHRIRPKTDL